MKLAGIVWVVGSLVAWVGLIYIFALVLIYIADNRLMKLRAGTETAASWTGIAGMILIPPFVAVLAMRGSLPWTGERSSKLRGFPLEALRPKDVTNPLPGSTRPEEGR